MMDLVSRVNAALEEGCPSLAKALSGLGRRVVLPAGIPVQAQEAKKCQFNGTIGMLTDGRGNAIPLPSMAAAFSGLSKEDQNRAFLYSPVAGIPELRKRWREWQLGAVGEGESHRASSSLPVVTGGLSHSLSILADLFGGEGRAVLVPSPFWGNYNHVFGTRTGARLISAPAFQGGVFNSNVFEQAIQQDGALAPDEPVIAILNLPSNPGGYSLSDEERVQVRESLLRIADQRPVLVFCDDAYAGLVFEDAVSPRSMFWDLLNLHDNLLPFKVDGATKEFSLFGGRVGFLTFPFEVDSPVATALENKAAGLVRATVGSPVASSQVLLLQALRSGTVDEEVEDVRLLLLERYRKLQAALAQVDPTLLRPQPFNSGCFALAEIPEELGVGAEQLRRHLLEHGDTGVVSIGDRYVRIAHCSVDGDSLQELVDRVAAGLGQLTLAAHQSSPSKPDVSAAAGSFS
ncbi:MAG: aminotransferase class I/II-fold pyridoxal phosphate-dependent enzyme [Deltaproteobacteria bacterium]|nr:aminotransferase class I/II-fold pyridoxal phosphate-dependent enzyme [Deltaproteobacteria bacterium]